MVMETLIIWVVFLIVDIILCIKRVPLIGFIVGVLQLFLVYSVLMADQTFSIYLSLFCAVLAGILILINALEMQK